MPEHTAATSLVELARGTLGPDFISPDEVDRSGLIVGYSAELKKKLEISIPSEGALKWCKHHGHALIPGPHRKLDLMEVRNLRPELFDGDALRQSLRISDRIAATVAPGWIAFRKCAVPDSPGLQRHSQNRLLVDGEVVPQITELIWGMLLYRAVRGTSICDGQWVRSDSLYQSNSGYYLRAVAGSFSGGIALDVGWDETTNEHYGLAACCRF